MASDGELLDSIVVLKSEQTDTATIAGDLSDEGQRAKITTDVSPSSSPSTKSVDEGAIDIPLDHNPGETQLNSSTRPTSPEHKPKYVKITRGRTGCLTCRERKKRCDEVFDGDGKCHTCRRLKLNCQKPSNSTPRKNPIRRHSTLLPLILHTTPTVTPPYPSSYTPQPFISRSPQTDLGFVAYSETSTEDDRILLRYYIDHLSTVCSVLPDGRNGFRSVIIPMAVSNRVLLSALYAFAAAHISHRKSASFQYQADLHYSRAVSALSSRMCTSLSAGFDDATAMASLLLCSVEAINGDTSKWAMHCIGVQRIIDAIGGPSVLRRNTEGLFVLRDFAYHDILAAVTAATPPLFPGHYWAEPSQPEDAVMGLTDELIAVLSRLCQLVCDTSDGTIGDDYILDEASAIEGALHDWKCPLLHEIFRDAEPRPSAYGDYTILAAIARAHRHAILIHLQRFLFLHSPSTQHHQLTQLEENASKIITELGGVPEGCQAEVGIVFPLFMAGAVTSQPANRVFVRDRLYATWKRTSFGNYERSVKLLEEMWRRGTMSWEDVLKDLGWKLMLA